MMAHRASPAVRASHASHHELSMCTHEQTVPIPSAHSLASHNSPVTGLTGRTKRRVVLKRRQQRLLLLPFPTLRAGVVVQTTPFSEWFSLWRQQSPNVVVYTGTAIIRKALKYLDSDHFAVDKTLKGKQKGYWRLKRDAEANIVKYCIDTETA